MMVNATRDPILSATLAIAAQDFDGAKRTCADGTSRRSRSGKLQLRGSVGPGVLTYKDTGLTSRITYTYVVTAWNDCNGNASFDVGVDTESAVSNTVSATAQ